MKLFFKNSMRLLVFALLAISCVLVLAPSASTQGIIDDIGKELGSAAGEEGAGFNVESSSDNIDLRIKIAVIIRYALSFVGTLFVALMVYAGILWMTAGGNDDQVGKAKKLIFQAVIGLFIVFSAYTITLIAYRLASGKIQDSRCRGSSSGQIDQANCGIE